MNYAKVLYDLTLTCMLMRPRMKCKDDDCKTCDETAIRIAIKRQIPKKPEVITDGHFINYFCDCGSQVYEDEDVYCSICGQKIDWELDDDEL